MGSDISGAAPVQSEPRGVGEAGACRTVCLVECPTGMHVEQVAVAVVWTERDGACRVISMRRMHQWEIRCVGLD